MSEYENLCSQLDAEKTKLTKLEVELHAVDSDTYFYQRKNDLNKLEELSHKKENLINEINSQKEVVDKLQSQVNSFKSEDNQKQKNEFKKQQEKINQEKLEQEKKEKQEFEFKKQQKFNQEKLEQEKKEKQEPEFKKQQKFNQKKLKKEKKEKQSNYFQQKQNNRTYNNVRSSNQLYCPKCGANINSRDKFCLNCGYQLKKEPVEKNDGNWAVRIFLKKKNDNGGYRFSISKIIGSIYAFLDFITVLSQYYFPENIIVALIASVLSYLIILIIGYIIRWIYNKYIK